jgi:hypothetical protein
LWNEEVAKIEREGLQAVLVLLDTIYELESSYRYLVAHLYDMGEREVRKRFAVNQDEKVFSAFYRVGYLKTGKMWFKAKNELKGVYCGLSQMAGV